MKKLSVLLFVIVFSTTVLHAQNIAGTWGGELKPAPTVSLKLFFKINKTSDGYSATLSVPQQNAKDLPVSEATFVDNQLSLNISMLKASYEGQLNAEGNKISGTFTQNGQSFPLSLEPSEIKKPNRPQTPQPPYPYETEDLTFENKAEGFSLAGTLTYPKDKKKLPAVILLTGSGAQNRDEEVFDHKPFHVIADHLTRQGIAVLRFDDRGFGKSGGDLLNATTQSFATDAQSAIDYLKSRPEIDSKKIGLIGHSEGGNVAFITAGLNQKDVAFIVSLAAMGETGKQTLIRQNETLSKAGGMSDQDWQKRAIALQNEYALLMQEKTIEELKADAQADALKKIPDEMRTNPETLRKVETAINTQITPWLVNFIKYDPTVDLAKVKCHVLVLNGDKDTQVEAEANTSIIASTLTKAGNKKAETKIYPSLNHFFQTAKTGMVSEYAQIEETINPQVLNDIALWIKNTLKMK